MVVLIISTKNTTSVNNNNYKRVKKKSPFKLIALGLTIMVVGFIVIGVVIPKIITENTINNFYKDIVGRWEYQASNSSMYIYIFNDDRTYTYKEGLSVLNEDNFTVIEGIYQIYRGNDGYQILVGPDTNDTKIWIENYEGYKIMMNESRNILQLGSQRQYKKIE